MRFIPFLIAMLSVLLAASPSLSRENYDIDTKGAHAFIQFKIKHLGYSWLLGRFNRFDGSFAIDREDMSNSSVEVTIDVASVDSNHAERDKHLRGDDFLNSDDFPTATFVSTEIAKINDTQARVTGDLTLHGVTRSIAFDAILIGEGKDPWGGYRMGFAGEVDLALKDYGIDYDLGPASQIVTLSLFIEGIKQNNYPIEK